LTQRRKFTIDGTEAALLQCAWQSAGSWMPTKLKKGLKISTQHFTIADIQHNETPKDPLIRRRTKLYVAACLL